MSNRDGSSVAVVKRYWPCAGRVTEVVPVSDEHGVNSSNVVVTASGPMGRRRFVLKKVGAKQAVALRRAAEVQRFAFCHGIRVPEMICCADSAELVAFEGGKAYTLQTFCQGYKYDGQLEDATAVGSALGQLHVLLRDVDGDFPDRPGYRDLHESELATIESRLTRQDTAFERIAGQVMRVLPSLYRKLDELEETVSPAQPVHIDCNLKNVLFPAPQDPVILDFGSIITLPRMQAVGYACHRFVDFDPDGVRAFLRAYSDIDAFAPGEAQLYPHFVAREAIRRVNFALRSHFFDGFSGWDFELERQFGFIWEALAQTQPYVDLSN